MRNEFTITKEEMLSWVKRYSFVGVGNKILFALHLLLGLVGVSLLILVIPSGGDPLSGAIGIASVVISVYKLFFERFVFMTRRYNLLAKTYGVPLAIWDNGAKGAGEECHAFIDHGTGEYCSTGAKNAIQAFTGSYNSILQLSDVYNNAPKF